MSRADRQLTDEETIRLFQEADYVEKGMTYIDCAIDKIYVLKFEVESMTGKGRKAK